MPCGPVRRSPIRPTIGVGRTFVLCQRMKHRDPPQSKGRPPGGHSFADRRGPTPWQRTRCETRRAGPRWLLQTGHMLWSPESHGGPPCSSPHSSQSHGLPGLTSFALRPSRTRFRSPRGPGTSGNCVIPHSLLSMESRWRSGRTGTSISTCSSTERAGRSNASSVPRRSGRRQCMNVSHGSRMTRRGCLDLHSDNCRAVTG